MEMSAHAIKCLEGYLDKCFKAPSKLKASKNKKGNDIKDI